jgi:hypothetical protein
VEQYITKGQVVGYETREVLTRRLVDVSMYGIAPDSLEQFGGLHAVTGKEARGKNREGW